MSSSQVILKHNKRNDKTLTKGTRPVLVAMSAIHVRSLSLFPNRLAGRTMVASGNASFTANSPANYDARGQHGEQRCE